MSDQESGRGMTRRRLLASFASFACTLPGVRAVAQLRAASRGAVPWDPRFELAVTLQMANEPGAPRPFLVVWIESPAGEQVRTVSLWIHQARGSLYMDEMRRWYRLFRTLPLADRLRMGTSVSSATRNAGSYTVLWNGRDAADELVEQGRYLLCLEAAREHGGYSLVRKELAFSTMPFRAELEASGELITAVSVDYRMRSTARPPA